MQIVCFRKTFIKQRVSHINESLGFRKSRSSEHNLNVDIQNFPLFFYSMIHSSSIHSHLFIRLFVRFPFAFIAVLCMLRMYAVLYKFYNV